MINWKEIKDGVPTEYGWYSVAINPVNWVDFEDKTELNNWRLSFGFSKAWYNGSIWSEADFHGIDSKDITDRVTHWANLPQVPLYPIT
jgi:hypothetical protein